MLGKKNEASARNDCACVLTVQLGNAETSCGVFFDDRLAAQWVTETRVGATPDDLERELHAFLSAKHAPEPNQAILCSVVPLAADAWEKTLRTVCGCRVLTVGPGLKTGLSLKYKDPAQVGADRVVCAVAAKYLYGLHDGSGRISKVHVNEAGGQAADEAGVSGASETDGSGADETGGPGVDEADSSTADEGSVNVANGLVVNGADGLAANEADDPVADEAGIIVADFNHCATAFSVVDRKGAFAGGIIAPGLAASMDALVSSAAQLVPPALRVPQSVLGRSTSDAVAAGVVMGEVLRADGFIDALWKELGGRTKLVATGRYASLIAQQSVHSFAVEPCLALIGLYRLWKLNCG